MPYNFMIYKRILGEIKARVPHFKPESLLDYGAGLGSGMWGGIDVYNDTLKRIAAVEPNTAMRKLGGFLTEDLNKDNNILWVDSLSMIPGSGGEKGKFDIIILGFVLQEVASAKAR
jgi:ribosomal protein RSM22 (predicted rRNA methylase)